MMAGRPPTLEGYRAELLMEIQCLQQEAAQKSIQAARLTRELNASLMTSSQIRAQAAG